jgi:hypothetical protein
VSSNPAAPLPSTLPAQSRTAAASAGRAWDAAAADRLLADLRQQLARMERRHRGRRFPDAIARLVADGVALCEAHVENRAKLTRQGWDAMAFLRGQVELTLALASQGLAKQHAETIRICSG